MRIKVGRLLILLLKKKSSVKQGFGIVDNRPEAVAQRKAQKMAKSSNLLKEWMPDLDRNTFGDSLVPLQRATVSSRYSGEEEESYNGIVSDATLFHNSFGTGVLFDDDADNVKSDKGAEGDDHVDVFGHGNSIVVGRFTPDVLAKRIKDKKETLNLTDVKDVTLHSCESAVPLDLSQEGEETRQKYKSIEGTTFAQRLHEVFLNEYQSYTETEGFVGETVTDRLGNSRVLKVGKTMKDFNRLRKIAVRADQERGDEMHTKEDDVENDFFEKLGEKKTRFGSESLEVYFGREEWKRETETSEDEREQMSEYLKWCWQQSAEKEETFETLSGEKWKLEEDDRTPKNENYYH
jgi:hypothetical protein